MGSLLIQNLPLLRVSAAGLTGAVCAGATALMLDSFTSLPTLPVVLLLSVAYVGGFVAGFSILVREFRS